MLTPFQKFYRKLYVRNLNESGIAEGNNNSVGELIRMVAIVREESRKQAIRWWEILKTGESEVGGKSRYTRDEWKTILAEVSEYGIDKIIKDYGITKSTIYYQKAEAKRRAALAAGDGNAKKLDINKPQDWPETDYKPENARCSLDIPSQPNVGDTKPVTSVRDLKPGDVIPPERTGELMQRIEVYKLVLEESENKISRLNDENKKLKDYIVKQVLAEK